MSVYNNQTIIDHNWTITENVIYTGIARLFIIASYIIEDCEVVHGILVASLGCISLACGIFCGRCRFGTNSYIFTILSESVGLFTFSEYYRVPCKSSLSQHLWPSEQLQCSHTYYCT